MQINSFDINIDKNKLYKALDIVDDTPVYDEAEGVFNDCIKFFYDKIKPLCLYEIKRHKIKNYSYSIFVIMTLGAEVDLFANELFNSGEYFKGYLLNGICDYYLMQMDNTALKRIKESLIKDYKNEIGFGNRFYPHENIEGNKMTEIIKWTNAEEYGINVNESFVLNPSKSIGFIIGADKDLNKNIGHSCKSCPNKACKWRDTDDKDKCYKE